MDREKGSQFWEVSMSIVIELFWEYKNFRGKMRTREFADSRRWESLLTNIEEWRRKEKKESSSDSVHITRGDYYYYF